MTYDSRPDTLAHIAQVRENMLEMITDLALRARGHDLSKLESPEKEAFDEATPRLRALTYGTVEYEKARADLGDALVHHYAVNRHHPEHWEQGIDGMNLLDLVEMLCDWYAATKRHDDGDLSKSLDINANRFMIGPQLKQIMRNTMEDFEWVAPIETEGVTN